MKVIKYILIVIVCLLGHNAITAQALKIMSYNIRLDAPDDGVNRWPLRKQQLASLINFHDPDILGCQEVQYHQLQYLLEQLPQFGYVGVGRDDGKNGGEFSPVFYKKQQFNVLEHGTFWLSETPDTVSRGWDAACNRVCSYALLQHKKTKTIFWAANTHLDHMGKAARLNSVQLIQKKMGLLNQKWKVPILLTGDFNEQPNEPAVAAMSEHYTNARTVSIQSPYGAADSWNAFDFQKQPNGCIDYIFFHQSFPLMVEKFATLTDSYNLKYPSDHLPVFAVIAFPEVKKHQATKTIKK